jgi:hypothetical protein
MTRKLVFGLVLSAVVAGVVAGAVILLRGGGGHGPTAPGSAPTGGTIAVNTYFYRGAGLVPIIVLVPRTKAVATAALRALLAGPPAGLRTAIPAGATLSGVSISAGTATGNFSNALAGAPRTAQAQIVYTLTQFASVHATAIDAGGVPVSLSNGAGMTLLRPATRPDFVDLTPDAQIFVASPLRDSTLTSPVDVSGTAVAFEGTISLEIWRNGVLGHTETITTSAGAPERGSWSTTLGLPPGSYRIVLYEPSAKDGSHLHTTSVEFRVTR